MSKALAIPLRWSAMLVVIVAALTRVCPAFATPYLHAAVINEYAVHNPNGVTIVGNGRKLQPAGTHSPLAVWPHGLVVSPDGSKLFIACQSAGHIVSNLGTRPPTLQLVRPDPDSNKWTSAGGAAISPDGKKLYWSGGDSGQINVLDFETGAKLGAISLNVTVGGRSFQDSYVAAAQLSADGLYLYCADTANFRLAIIDTVQSKVVGSVQVGRYPYALAVAGSRVYVANIGMFEYSAIPYPTNPVSTIGKPPVAVGDARDPRGITFPAFGFPSADAQNGVDFEGRHVPGLGDPNAPESFSVWGVDVSDPAHPAVTGSLKTGLLVGAPGDIGTTVGGSAPNYLLARNSMLYVSNNNNDMIQKVNLTSGQIIAQTRIIPSPLTSKLRGVCPCGMSLSPDGTRLYVAEMGLNAIAVLDAGTLQVLGHIPTAWYPYRVEVSKDGNSLYVINFRGFGNGPSAGANRPTDPYTSMAGVLSIVPTPNTATLSTMTATVLQCNGLVDRSADRAKMSSPVIPTEPGKSSSQIKYVVFITKENHTYDTIFDHITGANDDPTLLRWGLHQTLTQSGQPTLTNVGVMVNHNALARQFTVSDNFYMEPEYSGVGHRWLIGIQPNNWCQMTYTLPWYFSVGSTAPGRRAPFGGNGSAAPEDYPEAGSEWDHLARGGIKFRSYGEGFEFAGVGEDADEHPTGARETVNIPMPKVLYDNTSREFPIWNMNIPDQYRAFWFQREFQNLYLSGAQTMPSFIDMALCSDHGTGTNPARGYPYLASWMTDNDLALGRIVEFLSHTKYWPNMAIFVTEDDSGGEPDHVDAQRSVLLCISPWARRGYVSHRHTTILSMHRTLYQIFGLPPLNMFDAVANDLSDCFTTQPNYTPYTVVPIDTRIFNAELAKDPNDPQYAQARLRKSIAMDDPNDEKEILEMGEKESHPAMLRQTK